jgi:6-phosphogluconolactonase (cycloisomerase 2 family)
MSFNDYKYVGLVGCYTSQGQADPFESSLGGVPHDRTQIGEGIIAIGVDYDGRLSFFNDGAPIITAQELANPSYLTILEDAETDEGGVGVCVVSELEDGKWQPFKLTASSDDAGVTIHAKPAGAPMKSGGEYPCHITSTRVIGFDGESRATTLLFICNYGEVEGVLSIFSAPDFETAFKPEAKFMFGDGSKADLNRQQCSHAHSTSIASTLDPYSPVDICVADLGSDAIVQFSITSSGRIREIGRLAAPQGSGPRSLMFNPKHNHLAIVSLEMTGEVWLIRKRSHDGCLEGLGIPVSLLPHNWPGSDRTESQFNRGRWASDALWSEDGKYVYAAARLHDSISVFELKYRVDKYRDDAVVAEGLELVQRIPTQGRTPRCLCISECGQFLLVAHQHSHDVSSFERNEINGKLTLVDRIHLPNASCVKLIGADKL